MRYRKSAFKDFEIEIRNGTLFIARKKEFISFRPAQGKTITDLLGLVARMRRVPKLPPSIKDGNFQISFENTTGMVIFSQGGGRLEIEWKDLDALIETIEEAMKVGLDNLTLGGQKAYQEKVPDQLGD